MKRRIGLIGIITMSLLFSGCWVTGSGDKVGTVVSVMQSGLICKTWEIKIIRGGLQDGSGVMGQTFEATIPDNHPELVKKAQEALDQGYEVKLHFWKEANSWCRSDSQDHFVYSLERLRAVK